MLFSVKADAFGSAAKQFKQHGGQLSCNDKNQAAWVCNAKGSRGRPQTFVCFHCPLVASADAKPLRNKKVQLVLTPKSNEIKRNQAKSNEIKFS